MVVDFHLHIPVKWVKEGVHPKEAAEKIVSFIDEAGIKVAVLLPIAPWVSNDYVYKVVSYNPKRLIGFTSVVPNPAEVAIKELRRAVRDLGLRGLKLHPSMQGFCIRHPHVIKVLRAAGELGIPVVIHAMLGDLSTLYFKPPPGEHELPDPNKVEDYDFIALLAPNTVIVYAHMGGLFGFRRFMDIAASHPNVYLDTSYSILTIAEEIGPQMLAKYIKSLGADKLVFGSDHIIGLTPEELSAKKQIELIRNLPLLNNNEKEKILSGNALKILSTNHKT
ncbi:MAG: amidohydrolase family protein [Thermoprotei archaeon]